MNAKQCSDLLMAEEIFPQILSRLPVRSLLRFRSVSHQWRAIIDDPDFARLHLANFAPNRRPTHFFIARSGESHYTYVCNSTLKITSRLPHKKSGVPSLLNGEFVSSTDGMFVLRGYTTPYWPSSLDDFQYLIWNPTIKKTLTLPQLLHVPPKTGFRDIGLGFDPIAKAYKYVLLLLNCPTIVRVYSTATNSWSSCPFQSDDDRCSTMGKANFCLRGFMFSLAELGKPSCQQLVSFDLNSHIFASTLLPLEGNDSTYVSSLSMIDSGESLAVVNLSNVGSGSIWVLEGLGRDRKDWGWSKRATFASMVSTYDASRGGKSCKFFHLKSNNEMFLAWKEMVTHYDLGTHKEKKVVWSGMRDWLGQQPMPYIESMIIASVK